jgi:hypothetical protein
LAIYHLSAKVISRKAGQSAVACAAYRAAELLHDDRQGVTHDYTRKQGVEFAGVFAPKDAPDWTRDRAELWNAAEAAEKRKDATLAREYEVSLPHELTPEQRRYLVQDFIKENITRKGYVADVAIHEPSRHGDERNYHAHILVTDRRLEKDGFAADKKERQGSTKQRAEELETLRERWAEHGARHLARAGFETEAERFRHGHKTLKEQRAAALERGDQEHAEALDREATTHRGPHVDAMERKGIQTDRGDENRAIEARNAERAALREQAAEIERQERAFLEWVKEEDAREAALQQWGESFQTDEVRARAARWREKINRAEVLRDRFEAARDETTKRQEPEHPPETHQSQGDRDPPGTVALVGAYLDLCKDPAKDLLQWADVSRDGSAPARDAPQDAPEARRDAPELPPFAALPPSALEPLERATEAARDTERDTETEGKKANQERQDQDAAEKERQRQEAIDRELEKALQRLREPRPDRGRERGF